MLFAQFKQREHEAQEFNRIRQQGHGRPIISAGLNRHKLVAVGNTLHFSEKWKYFPDFLMDYIKTKIGADWGNEEIKKPFDDRHPLMKWYHQLCLFQASQKRNDAGHYNSEATGLIRCYLGLAYSLYLLDHNAELQQRLVERLKRPDQFQGAYYELIVANCMIRAGFELQLEDEADPKQKHCEFSARSKETGRRFWVEAKMRSVAGVLGKTDADGQQITSKPTSRLSKHLSDALRKPAKDERIIFIDVNTAPIKPEDISGDTLNAPPWMIASEKQLTDRERDLREGERAYVFVTNFCFHNSLDSIFQGQAILAFGLGIDDFGKPGQYSLKEAWRVKQKHIDLYNLQEAMKSYPQVPSQFDGNLPPVGPGERERIRIGRKYEFEETGISGEVTAATVSEKERKIYIAVSGEDGKSHILVEDISNAELEVYRKYPETYFGVVRPVGMQINDPYKFFEWIFNTYKNTPKEKLLEFMKEASDIEALKNLDQEAIALEYCERIVNNVGNQKSENAATAEPP